MERSIKAVRDRLCRLAKRNIEVAAAATKAASEVGKEYASYIVSSLAKLNDEDNAE